MSSTEDRPGESKTRPERNWLVWFDERWRGRSPGTRRVAAGWFRPTRVERFRDGLIYRLLGIRIVALVIPTGGLIWRRLFHWDGWSFGLGASSIRKAREYRYNTCVFELLHTVAFLLMVPDGIRAIQSGWIDGMLKFLIAGVLMNGYPWMLQRYNRVRIAGLMEKCKTRQGVRRGAVCNREGKIILRGTVDRFQVSLSIDAYHEHA